MQRHFTTSSKTENPTKRLEDYFFKPVQNIKSALNQALLSEKTEKTLSHIQEDDKELKKSEDPPTGDTTGYELKGVYNVRKILTEQEAKEFMENGGKLECEITELKSIRDRSTSDTTDLRDSFDRMVSEFTKKCAEAPS